ncbi:MAG: hypothetical protein IT434_04580 [Phycisphaerales bacterium]|jgi:hypothetical protein|nr:hypothetical protein [Phycisphaerales bacterium]
MTITTCITRRVLAAVLAAALAIGLGGCVVSPAGGPYVVHNQIDKPVRVVIHPDWGTKNWGQIFRVEGYRGVILPGGTWSTEDASTTTRIPIDWDALDISNGHWVEYRVELQPPHVFVVYDERTTYLSTLHSITITPDGGLECADQLGAAIPSNRVIERRYLGEEPNTTTRRPPE